MKKINFMLTAFRDGFQSVYGTKVRSEDFLPAVVAAKEAGVRHFESAGGATFQSALMFNNENPYDVMDAFRKAVGPEVNLQSLARGVNVVGLNSQPSDVIKLHAQTFKKHGLTTIRNFDALNDVNNLIYSGKCIKEAGLKHEVTITMMSLAPNWDKTGKFHTPEFYEGVLKNIIKSGIEFDSVCFKDASGTSTPQTVRETIKRAKKILPPEVKVVFHSHETAGTGLACYLAAIEGGVDSLDLSMAPVSGGTCQPDLISMWHALRGSDYTLDIDIDKIRKAENVLKECMKDYIIKPEAMKVEPMIPFSPLPGGALTNATRQLREVGQMDKYEKILAAMEEVVRRGGFGTSVTPVSQFYIQQSMQNVLSPEGPWTRFAPGYANMILGYFGKTPAPADPELVKLASAYMKKEPTTKTVLELNDADKTKGVKVAKELLEKNNLPTTDENIFIVAACNDAANGVNKGLDFLLGKAKCQVEKKSSTSAGAKLGGNAFTITIDGEAYGVELNGDKATINGETFAFNVKEGLEKASTPKANTAGGGVEVKAPMPGVVLKLLVADGASVKNSQPIMVMEAMKMETEIKATADGKVSFAVKNGDTLQTGTLIATIK
ncbi:MAG: hypothetical protein II972_04535 [Elusimicrobiaceae bacterium]|nr:hypothetical protein [Elusimicrobiaceae bacterium]